MNKTKVRKFKIDTSTIIDQKKVNEAWEKVMDKKTCGKSCKCSNKDLYKKALDVWGEDAQIGMVIEECGELLSAINKLERGRVTEEDFMEEVVDVYIMMNQMRELNKDLFDKIYKYKINRIRNKLNKKIIN